MHERLASRFRSTWMPVRTPWANEKDRERVSQIDSLRANGRRRPIYQDSINSCGRAPFVANELGRYPTTVMATDDVLGEPGCVFMVPKVRNAEAQDLSSCGLPASSTLRPGRRLSRTVPKSIAAEDQDILEFHRCKCNPRRIVGLGATGRNGLQPTFRLRSPPSFFLPAMRAFEIA